MKKIEIRAVRFNYLNKETHYEYMIVFHNLLLKYPNIRILVDQYWYEFLRLLELEASLVDDSKKSPITEKIKEIDDRIDRLIVSINAAIASALHHFAPEMVEAAKILRDRMKILGKIISKSYEGESAAIQLLLRDLQGSLVPQVNIVGIADRVNELANSESLFTQLFEERNAQLAGRLQLNLTEIHSMIDPLYRNMVICVNAHITVNNATDCIEFAKELNEQIKYFIDHSGRNKSKIDIRQAIVASIPDQSHTEEPITFIPNVEYEGKKLVFGTDFTVSFKNNTEIGNATLSIRGIGKYKDTKIVTFNIIKN